MAHRISRPPATVALLDDEPDVVPACDLSNVSHQRVPDAKRARCRRRLAVRSVRTALGCRATDGGRGYAAWVVDRDRGDRRRTERSQVCDAVPLPPIERLDGTP